MLSTPARPTTLASSLNFSCGAIAGGMRRRNKALFNNIVN